MGAGSENARPHVGIILPYLERGGTERHVLTLIRGLKERIRVTLFAPDGPLEDEVRSLGVDWLSFTRWDRSFVRGWQSLRRALGEAAHREPCDLFHVHGAHELMLAVPKGDGRRPVVFTCHGYHGSTRALSYRTAAWVANRRASQVIAVSRHEREQMLRWGFAPGKLHLIWNGVEDPMGADRAPAPTHAGEGERSPGRFVVGAVARLEPAKGLDLLIRSIDRLAARDGIRIECAIAGSGSEEGALRELARELGVEDRVRFLGYVPRAAEAMSSFDALVHPALEEPFGLVIAEAMASGLPVVASRVGGIPEIVADGETGTLVPPGEVEHLAEAIWRIARDPEKAKSMGAAGRARYLEHFSSEQMIERTVRVYERALGLG